MSAVRLVNNATQAIKSCVKVNTIKAKCNALIFEASLGKLPKWHIMIRIR